MNKNMSKYIKNGIGHLTLTRVVFEYVLDILFGSAKIYLTLTRVVFEFATYKGNSGQPYKFNFNKSCI